MVILMTDGSRALAVEGIYKLQVQKAPRVTARSGPDTQAPPILPRRMEDVYDSNI